MFSGSDWRRLPRLSCFDLNYYWMNQFVELFLLFRLISTGIAENGRPSTLIIAINPDGKAVLSGWHHFWPKGSSPFDRSHRYPGHPALTRPGLSPVRFEHFRADHTLIEEVNLSWIRRLGSAGDRICQLRHVLGIVVCIQSKVCINIVVMANPTSKET